MLQATRAPAKMAQQRDHGEGFRRCADRDNVMSRHGAVSPR